MNSLFQQLQNLDIDVNDILITDTQNINDPILKAIKKYGKHPSITKINENIRVDNKFSFSTVPLIDIKNVANSLDASKSTTYCNIPHKDIQAEF